jgi:hypothetical protein
MLLQTLRPSPDPLRRPRRLPSALIALLVAALLGAPLAGCGGGSSGIGAVDAMPSGASGKSMEKAEACDDGDLDACNWLGIWFLVGGAGKERRGEGVRYIRHACDEGLDKACRLLSALKKAAANRSSN